MRGEKVPPRTVPVRRLRGSGIARSDEHLHRLTRIRRCPHVLDSRVDIVLLDR
jgi:hypothetical protein